METRHLYNQPNFMANNYRMIFIGLSTIGSLLILISLPTLKVGIIGVLCFLSVIGFLAFTLIKGRVILTLTATHLQQHFFKGGWVVRWSDVNSVGPCTQLQEGWHKPLPWVGIRLNDYQPYLDSICPRIATDILLSQRALLYVGARQTAPRLNFDDIVLDSTPYTHHSGKVYTGLSAMLANRMTFQREFFGFDIFIAEGELDRSTDEFIGLARRYLAAAERER
jgi:hypothetical protein